VASIKKYQKKDGSTAYMFKADLPPDPRTGKRRQTTKRGFKTKKEAQLAAAKLLEEVTTGNYIQEENILFKDFANEWLKMYEFGGSVKISTVRVRKHEVNNLNKYFANSKLKNITKKMYQDALIDLKKKKEFADNTISGIHATGRMIFQKAIELDLIKSNPTEYAKVPKTQETVEMIENQVEVIKYLEKEELALFLKTAMEKGLERDYIMFLVLGYSGMRAGELVALKWKDIDFGEQTISITKTYYNPNNNTKEYQLLPPKTKGSIRTIEMDPFVIDELKKYRFEQNKLKMLFRDVYYDHDFVFAKVENNPGYPEFIKTIENRMRRLLKLSGLDETLTPHSLRHTHTSLLAEAGVGLHEIMDRLGHVDDSTTKNVYLHVTKTMKKEASQKFGELMKSFRL
jgi:integrase